MNPPDDLAPPHRPKRPAPHVAAEYHENAHPEIAEDLARKLKLRFRRAAMGLR